MSYPHPSVLNFNNRDPPGTGNVLDPVFIQGQGIDLFALDLDDDFRALGENILYKEEADKGECEKESEKNGVRRRESTD